MTDTAPLVLDLGLVLLAAAGAGWIARRIGIPAVIGYLAVGLAVSPFTPGYVADRHQLELFAEVGVILLLFEVGIEVDLLRLRRENPAVLLVAPFQTVVTAVIAGLAFLVAGVPPLGASLIGIAVSMSSSVVIVNMTRSRRRTTDEPTERTLLSWSVLQDVTGVAIALIVVGFTGLDGRPVPLVLLGFGLYGVGVAVVAWVLPRVLRRIRDEHDLFLIVSVATGLAVAGAGAVVFGVPAALAAFLAGLAITEGRDTLEARRRLVPFRDVFAVLFFVAIGSLVNPAEVVQALPWLLALVALVIVAKSGVAYGLVRLARVGARPGQVGVGLGQVGEFSFVLGTIGVEAGVVGEELFTALLAAVIVTIAGSTIFSSGASAAPGPAP